MNLRNLPLSLFTNFFSRMQPDKKQLEILLLHYFRELYPDFPKSRVVPSESPDFLVKLQNRHVLGIELTRLHPKTDSTQDEFKSKENKFKDDLIAFAREIFEQDSPFKLFVKFLFSSRHQVGQEREMVVAVQSVNAIGNALKNRKSDSFFKILIQGETLPAGVEKILVVNHPGLKTSVWERANNLGSSADIMEDISLSVFKKEEKFRIYQRQRLNFYWLLVTADLLTFRDTGDISDHFRNNLSYSRFQQVFLLDLMNSNVIKLV